MPTLAFIKPMLLLGIDLGTSSIKVSVLEAATAKRIATIQLPDTGENEIRSLKNDWAEQSPDLWWAQIQEAIKRLNASGKYDPAKISAIGIAYQMHGLVLVDREQKVVRDSIIWCDSRAIGQGEKAFRDIGETWCLTNLLNSPGNFTAAKLAWVKEHEPRLFENVRHVLLPGDFIAMKLTRETTTTASALSEGIFWDYSKNNLSQELMDYFGFDRELFPEVRPVFSSHGKLETSIAKALHLSPGIPVSYKAGDQPNNALSLNVMNPGEIAANAGTSGVIYGISEQLDHDSYSRINNFAHVNHSKEDPRIGVLLCINGTGSMNRWAKNNIGGNRSYQQINDLAEKVAEGAEGIKVLPFGNGAERMLRNQLVGASIEGLNLNIHDQRHLFRAVQEGIAFSFRYGLDIAKENGLMPTIIRANRSNLFLSGLFTRAFVELSGVPLQFYDQDGSTGAAIGAGIGAGIYQDSREPFQQIKAVQTIEPTGKSSYLALYDEWHHLLDQKLTSLNT